MRRAMSAVFTVMVVMLLSASAHGPRVYRNKEFGIMLPVPKEALLCPTPAAQHDHGPVVLLGTNVVNVSACSDRAHSRSIGIFAEPNASYVSKKLLDYLNWQCANLATGSCSQAPADLQIPGLPSMAGKVDLSGGWIDIIVVTQAGKPDPDFDASVPSVNYDLRLHTTSEHLEDDLAVFRRVLQTVKLLPAR